MPIYEYECVCGGEFELLRKMEKSGQDAPCPFCSKSARRIFSIPRKHLTAETFTVIGHDGTVLSQTQTTERTSLKIRKKSGKVVNA